jgi:diguanylate cyclase (GGDEF)-like protein
MELDRSQRRSLSEPTARDDLSMRTRDDSGLPHDSADMPVADLVGWAIQGHLPADEPLSPELAREVLATALGLRPGQLDGLDDVEVGSTLSRLRALVTHVQRLHAEVAVDELTGALRRGAGLDALEREIARFRRAAGKGVALVFIDVDGLKAINDTDGHSAGDALLTAVVDAIRERLRAYDLIIRWGGDEFVCVLSDASPTEAARTVADIEANVRARTGGRTVSTGLAELETHDTAASLVARADAALYAGRELARS